MHVFLFDIDGTLLSSGGAGKAALESALIEEFGLEGLRATVPYSGRTDRAIIRELLQKHDITETPATLEQLLGGYLRRLPEYLTKHQGRVLPGIEPLLQQLQQTARVALGLLTGNVRAGARTKLGHYGIYDYFAFGGFGDHHWDRDDVAREALGAIHTHVGAHVALEQIWVIGDTPLDVQCARAIGVKVAAVATGWHSVDELARTKPDLLFENLSDATRLLAHLC